MLASHEDKEVLPQTEETLIRVETMATSQNMEYAKITQLSTANKVMTDSKANLKKSELETDAISGNFPFSDMVQISKAAEKRKIPNIMGFVLRLLKMLLYAIYINNKKVIEENKLLNQQPKNIMITSTLGTAEVFPVDSQSFANDESVNNDAKEHEQPDELEKSMETQSDLNPIKSPV
nr:bidirectional sugar transporter sweet15 [Quercus suber]